MEQPKLAVVITTVDRAETANSLANQVIDERLAACVQVDGPLTSHYIWEGQRESSTEYRVVLKTTCEVAPQLVARLGEIHPYDTPQIVQLDAVSTDAYLRWVEQSVGS
jgi:periplasmic divalent cation tolerance protein